MHACDGLMKSLRSPSFTAPENCVMVASTAGASASDRAEGEFVPAKSVPPAPIFLDCHHESYGQCCAYFSYNALPAAPSNLDGSASLCRLPPPRLTDPPDIAGS